MHDQCTTLCITLHIRKYPYNTAHTRHYIFYFQTLSFEEQEKKEDNLTIHRPLGVMAYLVIVEYLL